VKLLYALAKGAGIAATRRKTKEKRSVTSAGVHLTSTKTGRGLNLEEINVLTRPTNWGGTSATKTKEGLKKKRKGRIPKREMSSLGPWFVDRGPMKTKGQERGEIKNIHLRGPKSGGQERALGA